MICSLCEFDCEKYTEHHFFPRTVHPNKWFKKRYKREQLNQKTPVCRECHHAIHDLIPSEKDLGRNFNTIEKLKENDKIKKYLMWKKRKL